MLSNTTNGSPVTSSFQKHTIVVSCSQRIKEQSLLISFAKSAASNHKNHNGMFSFRQQSLQQDMPNKSTFGSAETKASTTLFPQQSTQRGSRPHKHSREQQSHTLHTALFSFSHQSHRFTQLVRVHQTNHNMSEQASTNYKEAFALFDKRGNGRVSLDSLGDLLRACGQNPTLAEIGDLEKGVGGDCKCRHRRPTNSACATRHKGRKSIG